MKAGRSYFGDGRSHIMNFRIEGESNPERPGKIRVTAQVCARLEPEITSVTEAIRTASPFDRPYWHLERARQAGTRKVPVELIVNGMVAGVVQMDADGKVQDLKFETAIERSSWIALRILPSSHTNPIYALVQGAPLRASRKSAEWCRKAVDVCWASKSPRIRKREIDKAAVAWDHARVTYDRIISECVG